MVTRPGKVTRIKSGERGDAPSVGQRLRDLRRQRNLTLGELSDKCGISVSSLSRIENTHLSLNLEKIQSLAVALEVVPEVFLGANPGESGAARPTVSELRSAIDRQRDRLPAVREGEVSQQHLFAEVAGRCLDCVHAELDPISIWDSEFISHPGEKAVYVLAGELVMYIQGRSPMLMETGDALFMDGCLWHSAVAANATPARALVFYCTGTGNATSPGNFESRFFIAREWADFSG